MTPADIKEASDLLDEREKVKQIIVWIKDHDIYQISIRAGQSDPSVLDGRGTGWLSSVCPTPDVLTALTKEWKEIYARKLIEINKTLSDMEVDV